MTIDFAGKAKVLQIAEVVDKVKQKPGGLSKYEQLIETEWLLSNNRGSFSCGTIAGCNTRRYHALLVGSLTPPAQRTVALSACAETIHTPKHSYNLSHFEFEPPSSELLEPLPVSFSKDAGVHFEYSTESFNLTKSIYLLPESDIIAICYDFTDIEEEFEFTVRPLVAMRDYHSLKKASDEFFLEWFDEFLAVRSRYQQGQLFLSSEEMAFVEEKQWWNNFFYRQEKQRGYDYKEDLFSPGVFRRTIDGRLRIVLWAGFGTPALPQKMTALDVDVIVDDIKLRQKQLLNGLKSKDHITQSLAVSGDEFVIDRHAERAKTKSILAGFPWFMDWGRDAFIAFEGLLLCSGRYEDAASVLLNFSYHADEGMIPNCFGEGNSGAQFNSIDSSLWFIHAAFKYYKASGDIRTFSSRLMPLVRWIIDSYCKGAKFGIKTDDDGLITGGSAQTQLTWMDSKVDDTPVTPRFGKAVEVNALWYNAICNCAEFYRAKDVVNGRQFSEMADRIANSFRTCFWCKNGQYLYDCVTDDFKDASIRPNQIFAVSLPFSPLNAQQQKAVVDCVEKELLTPFGLRTLSPKDNRYKGKYEGDVRQRDSAYHQGTVWPWLMGAFIEAYLKVNDYSKPSRRDSLLMLKPLLRHFKNDGCAGSVSEIFDGDEPHKSRGAFAQAWSVAELLRAYLLIHS
ncbi:MAG: amylo-alpha-1,6-glucosidase [Sedimentisphaerales bacterium]